MSRQAAVARLAPVHLHAQATASSLGLARVLVFGTWLCHLAVDPLQRLSELPRSAYQPPGVLVRQLHPGAERLRRLPGQPGGQRRRRARAGLERPPQVTIAAPLGGGRVSGTVPVRVDAFDDVGVTRVEWLVDGLVKGSDSSAPFAFAWDTGGLEDRSGHRLQLKAYDAAGNANRSGIRTVFVGRDATP
jgi:hypothetical protein